MHLKKKSNFISLSCFSFWSCFLFLFPSCILFFINLSFHYLFFALSACLLWILWTTFGQLLFSTFLIFIVIILLLQRRLCLFCPCSSVSRKPERTFHLNLLCIFLPYCYLESVLHHCHLCLNTSSTTFNFFHPLLSLFGRHIHATLLRLGFSWAVFSLMP